MRERERERERESEKKRKKKIKEIIKKRSSLSTAMIQTLPYWFQYTISC